MWSLLVLLAVLLMLAFNHWWTRPARFDREVDAPREAIANALVEAQRGRYSPGLVKR